MRFSLLPRVLNGTRLWLEELHDTVRIGPLKYNADVCMCSADGSRCTYRANERAAYPAVQAAADHVRVAVRRSEA